jgi:expansin (peptidoglycan-binding protein)
MYATDLYVAIASEAWGASTYDTMTGKATNKWCGQKIRIEYNGKSVDAKVMDMCPGCAGHDLDLSDAAWAAIGMTEWTRVKGSWSMIN